MNYNVRIGKFCTFDLGPELKSDEFFGDVRANINIYSSHDMCCVNNFSQQSATIRLLYIDDQPNVTVRSE